MGNQDIAVNPFRGKSSLVLRTLISQPDKAWKGTELANELGMSPAWVNRVLTTLEAEQIVQRGGTGPKSDTRLLDAKELLRQWLIHYRFNRNKTHLYLVQDSKPIKKLHHLCQQEKYQYALSGYEAANLIDKVIYDVPPMAYLWPGNNKAESYRSVLARIENIYDFIPVTKNANIIIIEPYLGDTVFFHSRVIKGITVVSPLQLFLDLTTMTPDKFVINELAAFWKKNHIPYDL